MSLDFVKLKQFINFIIHWFGLVYTNINIVYYIGNENFQRCNNNKHSVNKKLNKYKCK